MNTYEVVGYEHRNGIRKRDNKEYDIDIIHVIHNESLTAQPESYGKRVESFVFNRLVFGKASEYPVVGDQIKVYFNRSGFPESFEII